VSEENIEDMGHDEQMAAIGEVLAAEMGVPDDEADEAAEEVEEVEGDDAEPEAEAEEESDEEADDDEADEATESKPERRREVDTRSKDQRNLDSQYAELRRARGDLKRRQQEFHEARQTDRAAQKQAEELVMMAKGNPLAAFDEIAKQAGWSGEEFLDRVQHRIMNDGAPGQTEQADSMQAVLAEVRAMRDENRQLRQQAQQATYQQAQATDERNWSSGLSDLVINGKAELPGVGEQQFDGDRWQYVAALANAQPDVFRREMGEMVSMGMAHARESGEGVPPPALFDILDTRLREAHDRSTALAGHLGGNGSSAPKGGTSAPAPKKRRAKIVQRTTPKAAAPADPYDDQPDEIDFEKLGQMLLEAEDSPFRHHG